MFKNKLDAALYYAKKGSPIIPIWHPLENGKCSCGNPKCDAIGKHPMIKKWQDYATTDKETIKKHWKKNPDSNIAIHTGKAGIAVVDVDGKKGMRTIKKLEKIHGKIPKTPKAQSGNGFHLFFKAPTVGLKPNAGKIGPKVDLRVGDSIIIVSPSSIHSDCRNFPPGQTIIRFDL